MPKNMKRIHKVVIKRMIDESPDTSWLGEYGQRAESDYAIDRRHKPECLSLEHNHRAAVDQLERVIAYLETVRQAGEPPENIYWAAADESQDVLTDLQRELEECDCGGVWIDRNSYEFFNPNHENYKGLPADEIRKYCLQDYARMESLNNGDFCFIGIRAESEYWMSTDADAKTGKHGTFLMQTLTSGGLWGIESDSSPEYFTEIEQEELAELKKQLKALGFSSRAISTAFKNVERKES